MNYAELELFNLGYSMERIKNLALQEFPPARLYLDDLKDIISILQENNYIVTLETDCYKKITPDELDKVAQDMQKNKFEKISIRAKQSDEPRINDVYIYIWKYGIYCSFHEEDAKTIGVRELIRSVVDKKKIYFYLRVIIAFFIILFFTIFLEAFWLHQQVGTTYIFISVGLFLVFACFYRLKRWVIVYTKNNKSENFLNKYKNKILIGTIISFFSELLPVFIKNFFR